MGFLDILFGKSKKKPNLQPEKENSVEKTDVMTSRLKNCIRLL